MYPNYNPYYGNYMPQQMPRMDSQYQPQQNNPFKVQTGLLGKSVDSLDVVKAIDIPLDREHKLFSANQSEQ